MKGYTVEAWQQDVRDAQREISRLREDMGVQAKEVAVIKKDMEDCCSVADLQNRAIAHRDLQQVIQKLDIIVSNISELHALKKDVMKNSAGTHELQKQVDRIKIVAYLVTGGAVALNVIFVVLEYLGVIEILKNQVMN